MASQASTADANQDLARRVAELERELTKAHRREAAAAEVLRVIGSSPTDLQPVFDAIVASCQQLLAAHSAIVTRLVGRDLMLAAFTPVNPQADEELRRLFPTRGGPIAAAVRERTPFVIDDTETDDRLPQNERLLAHRRGYRSLLVVPMLSKGHAVGTINVTRSAPGGFSEQEIRLLQTFADQAVIAIENTRLFEAEQASKRELQESLDYQTSTSEVLGVISRSPTNVQPVFDTIARSAARLCSAVFCFVYRFDGKLIHFAASDGLEPEEEKAARSQYPLPPCRASAATRAILNAAVEEIPDVEADSDYEHKASAKFYRSIVAVPMLKDGCPIGAIAVSRPAVGPFPKHQIDLLETFADQAVIAIENTRLFETEQASKRELTEALEQQTATADVLKVISRSALDLQRVLDALVESAARLCDAYDAAIFQVFGDGVRLVAHHGQIPTAAPIGQLTLPLVRGAIGGRAVIDKRTIHVADILAEADEYPESRKRALQLGYRTVLCVPLVHAGEAIGTIFIRRAEVRPFTERQIELVNTFADQAVIAIENTRLFEEVQARTKELQEALDRQTATSEVLGVISRSPNEVQPVLDTIVATARRLCQAERAVIWRLEGETFSAVAHCGQPEERVEAVYSARGPVSRGNMVGRATLARRAVQVEDVATDPELVSHAFNRAGNVHTSLAVPLLLKGHPIGVISLTRTRVARFDDKQVALVESFADQAVIAIENARLFEEVQARNRDLTALGEVGRAVSSTLDLKVVLKTIVERAVELSGTDGGSIFYYRQQVGRFELGETTGLDEEVIARFRKLDIAAKDTGLGEAIEKRQPLPIPDLTKRPSNLARDAAIEAGLRASLIVPLLSSDGPLGALVLQRRRTGEFSPAVVNLMQNFADQSAIALENARLFEEIARKSQELEIASQHKSQFVANMSHELRTPLAAMLGYAELLRDGMFGELPEKSVRIIERVQANGKHLLGLINTVLDISKIESGQFQLCLVEYSLDSMVETVRVATESLASAKKLSFRTDVVKGLPYGLGDEPRLTQVLLNLVGNAIKFTDAGEVCISADAKYGSFVVSVTDTGPGIPDEERERIFDKFHQVDSTSTKTKGGTGLGLAIAKEIIEMHGGRIWVESIVGRGSTFRMELPVRAQASGAAA